MVDAALAASYRRKEAEAAQDAAEAEKAKKLLGFIPEFKIVRPGQAYWCGSHLHADKTGWMWAKHCEEWYVLKGPDPKYNIYDREKHKWVKNIYDWKFEAAV